VAERTEWQPARYRYVHEMRPGEIEKHRAILAKIERLIVRIRKSNRPMFLSRPCDSQMWFEIHPEDVNKFEMLGAMPDGFVVCEHEILTD
jgi:hypothetical protein